MSEPSYPSAPTRLAVNATDAGFPDVTAVAITVIDPTGIVLVNAAAMTLVEDEWVYYWPVPVDAGGKTFQTRGDVLDAVGNTTPVYGEIWVQNRPAVPSTPNTPQPVGVDPVTSHFVEPWCDESDIPAGRLTDSMGAKIADLNLGWMISAATDLLYVLSGRKFRAGRTVARPTMIAGAALRSPAIYPYSSAGVWGGYGSAWGFPAGWSWATLGLGWQAGRNAGELVLQAPVRRINRVVCDGIELAAETDYVVFNRRRLVRTNGQSWPWDQDSSYPTSETGTWEVDYEWGRPPKDSGRLACAELSIELARGFSGQDSCKLSPRTLTVATEGVTVSTGVSIDYLKEDLCNLPLVDLFLRAENPNKRRRPAVFLSPDKVLNRTT